MIRTGQTLAPRAWRPLLALGAAAVVLGLALGGALPSRAQQPQEGWAVYEATTDISSMGLLVASTAGVGDIRTCTLLGGGLCTADPATDRKLSDVNVAMVLGPYPTEYEAQKAFCDNIVPGSEFRAALSSMMMAQMAFDGQNHGISNGPACPPAPPAPATVPPSTPPPPTVAPIVPTPTPEFEGCVIRGTVRDAGANPTGYAAVGHPLVGVDIQLEAYTTVLKTVATDENGRYEFVVTKDDLPAYFDIASDYVRVRLRLREIGHSPPRFVVEVEGAGTSLYTDRLVLADECGDSLVERDFLLGDIPSDYDDYWPEADRWDDIGEIYDRIYRATELADFLGQPLDYKLPVIICAFCTGVTTEDLDYAGWCGAASNGDNCTDDRPSIDLGNDISLLSDGNWPDNREYHEFGHHFMADSFNDAIPASTGNVNHGGYYANPSSGDSWAEGFAEFFSIMVSKHIDNEPMPHLYWLDGGLENLELEYRPWYGLGWGEEFAVAGLLLDLEDGPEDYVQAREQPNLRIAWHDFFDEPALGRLLVGEVVNDSPSPDPYEAIDYSEQTMVAAQFLDQNGQEVFVGWASTVPWDVPALGGRGFFSIALPPDLSWDSFAVVAFEGRPGDVLTDDDPVNLTLQELWDTIVQYVSVQPESNGYLFDVADLYEAMRSRFGGRDADGNGMDDIDQVFIAHGLFADADGNQSFRAETPGRTDHPAYLEFPAYIPRRDAPPAPGARVEVNAGGVDARVLVQVTLPEPNQYHGYSYLATPDEDNLVHVALPPPEYGGTAALTVLAQGYKPAIAGVIEAETFWKDVEAANGEPFLSFDVTLERGDITPSDGSGVNIGWLLVGAGGVALMTAAGASVVVMRRRGGNA
jgi:hypothetical protein